MLESNLPESLKTLSVSGDLKLFRLTNIGTIFNIIIPT